MANSTHDRRRRNITEAATANNAKEDGSRMMGASGHCHRQKTDGRCSVGCPQPTRCSEPIGWGQPTLQRWQYQDAPAQAEPLPKVRTEEKAHRRRRVVQLSQRSRLDLLPELIATPSNLQEIPHGSRFETWSTSLHRPLSTSACHWGCISTPGARTSFGRYSFTGFGFSVSSTERHKARRFGPDKTAACCVTDQLASGSSKHFSPARHTRSGYGTARSPTTFSSMLQIVAPRRASATVNSIRRCCRASAPCTKTQSRFFSRGSRFHCAARLNRSSRNSCNSGETYEHAVTATAPVCGSAGMNPIRQLDFSTPIARS